MAKVATIKELREDLARKYRIHGPKVEEIWRRFDRTKRTRALRSGAADGVVLEHSTDKSMGDAYKIIPEFNLHDVTQPGSDYLLQIMKHRATTTLCEQYFEGPNKSLGDASFILNSMKFNNLRCVDLFPYCITVFFSEEMYGKSYRQANPADYAKTLTRLGTYVREGTCVPQSTGELILERQLYTLQLLNILIEDILDGGSKSRDRKEIPKKSIKTAREALENLSITTRRDKLSIPELLAIAADQKAYLDDQFHLCRTEPVFLAHMANVWFFSRPELIKDEKGRILPMHTDKYIRIAMFEMIHNLLIGIATWDYITNLLQMLHGKENNRGFRSMIMQELSNVCHMEFARTQKIFKRHVQSGSGLKYFKRISGAFENGTARVNMNGKPEMFTRENPQLHYMLRLCQSEMDATKAVLWIKNLDELHKSHPSDREKMEEREFESFSDLAVVVGFVQCLSASLSLPSTSSKKGQIYVSKSKELAAELDSLKTKLELTDFAIPIDNLKEPGMSEKALETLDEFVTNNTGTKMGHLYQDLVETCLVDFHLAHQQSNAKTTRKNDMNDSLSTTPINESVKSAYRIEQRRLKDKTRLAHSSIYNPMSSAVPDAETETVETPRVFKVSKEAADTFSALFSKTELRRSVTWASFESAMAHLKFSVTPKYGSVLEFLPPKDLGLEKSLTLHRPHNSRIEGHKLLLVASRLKRVFGWGEKSFEAAV